MKIRHAYGGAPVAFSDKGDKGENASVRDAVFAAIMSCNAAAYSLSIENAETAYIAFPVIVVDADLFSCELPDAGPDFEVEPIRTAIPLRWARPLGGRKLTAIDVVAANDLATYVQESASMARELLRELVRAGR
jgi:hypothetical protein